MHSDTQSSQTGQRLMSVDALRGFDMLWIIGGSRVCINFANASGLDFLKNTTVHFDHTWGQFHFYDLIMPLFLFIVGVVMPVSLGKRLERGDSKKKIHLHVLRRVVILYILGLLSSGHILTYDINKIHLYTNTLHCIAVGYAVSAVLILEASQKWQIIIPSLLLFLYWGVTALVPVPGHGAGLYEPNLNLALYIDDLLLGHFQEGSGWTYILTNMTFVGSVMLGVFAGKILLSNREPRKKVDLIALYGLCCIVAAKIWGIWFPIIHHLWTSSLVLFAGGLSALLLALFYLIIDVWGYKKWAFFFVVIGMNAISVYVATHMFNFERIGNVFVGGLSKCMGQWDPFVKSIAAFTIVWLILYWMYRKKTFIKI